VGGGWARKIYGIAIANIIKIFQLSLWVFAFASLAHRLLVFAFWKLIYEPAYIVFNFLY